MPLQAARGVRTGGLDFDGVDDKVIIPHSDSLNLNTLTVSAWFNSTMEGAWARTLVGKYGDTFISNMWILGWMEVRTLGFVIRDVNRVLNYTTAPVGAGLDGQWHHAVGVASIDYVQFWLDGVLQGQVSRTAGDIRNDRFVSLAYHANQYVRAAISEVRIYNRPLTGAEIIKLYRGHDVREGLVLLLDFTEGEGNVAYDKSGYNNNGTLYGDVRWVVKKASRVLTPARVLTVAR